MSDQSRPGGAGAPPADGLAAGEQEQLVYALDTRFAPHLEAAAATVREAERLLTEATDRLAHAEREAAAARYTSDPLVFMRQSVEEEVEALARKTTAKKVRTSYRFLLDRAVELAAGEVQRFHDDQEAARQEREEGIEACREAQRRAGEALEAARTMQERVRSAEQSAREGLSVMVEKLTARDR